MKFKIREPLIDQSRDDVMDLIVNINNIIMGIPAPAISKNLDDLLTNAEKNKIICEFLIDEYHERDGHTGDVIRTYEINMVIPNGKTIHLTREVPV